MNQLFELKEIKQTSKREIQAYTLWNEWVVIRQKVRSMEVYTQEQQNIKDLILNARKPDYIKTKNLYNQLIKML